MCGQCSLLPLKNCQYFHFSQYFLKCFRRPEKLILLLTESCEKIAHTKMDPLLLSFYKSYFWCKMFCKWKWIWKIEVKMCLWAPVPHPRLTPAFPWQIMIKIPHLHSKPQSQSARGEIIFKKTFSYIAFISNIEVILTWPESEIFKHEWNLKSSDKKISQTFTNVI